MKSLLVLSLLVTLAHAFATEKLEVTPNEREIVAQKLLDESTNADHDKKTQRLLKKVGKAYEKSKEVIELELKNLNEQPKDGRTKGEVIITKVGYGVGKGASWLSTTTAKPFMMAAGFFRGLFEKKDSHKDLKGLYQFFLNHDKEFDSIYVLSGKPKELVDLMLGKMEDIMKEKSNKLVKAYLIHLGIKREIPDDLADFELTDEELGSIDMSKLDPSFINNHPDFQEIRPIVGDVTKEELVDIVSAGVLDKSIGFENYKEALPRIEEGAFAILAQVYGPKLVLGLVSKSLAGLYAAPVIISDVATGVSVAICLQKDIQAKFDVDKDLKSFCSYVVNRSAYQLMKSRAKGYVKGKEAREKIEEGLEKRKARRAQRTSGAERTGIRLLIKNAIQ